MADSPFPAAAPSAAGRFVTLLIAAIALASTLLALAGVRTLPADVPVQVYARRFDELRPLLPAHGRVGYVSDVSRRGDTEEAGLYFYLTQYFLAPLVLERGTAPDLVIGDFQDRVPSPRAFAAEGLRVVRTFENGIVLYSRTAP